LLFGGYLIATLTLITGGMFAIGGSVTLGIGTVLLPIEEGGGAVLWSFQGANGEIQVLANVSQEGETLVLTNTHIQGAGAGTSSLREMRTIFEAIGRSQSAQEVLIYGAERTSGAMPGHIPRPITITVP
jgi:hypothetical protein